MTNSSSNYNKNCAQCGISNLCFTVGLTENDIQEIDNTVKKHQVLHKGDNLFYADDKFEHIYAVRSGSFKTLSLKADGTEQINGFYFSGELIGFAAIAEQRYLYSAIALETSSACAIPYENLFELAGKLPNLQRQIMNLMSQQLSPIHNNFMHMTAEQRIIQFILGVSARMKRRGLSDTDFSLSMSRQDIANYLGLAAETVSRLFKQMQQDGWIDLHAKQITIIDSKALQGRVSG